ncbi:MAG: DUF3039 domain-containing protein [Actinomycetales bacterium]|nr:DUF3039 domain-containing protein [Actinomycetales bacterium]
MGWSGRGASPVGHAERLGHKPARGHQSPCASQHLAGHTINGDAVRALCGTFFVPRQDHRALPTCPTCQDRWDELPDS